MKYEIGFPKMGINFNLDPTAFTLFGLEFRWYGIIIAIGVVLAMLYMFKDAKRFGIDPDKMPEPIFAGLIGGIAGARIYFVIMRWDSYKDDLLSIFNLRQGGLAIYGGIILGLLAGFVALRIKKVKVLPAFDIAGLCFLIGQGIGRWGNFCNQEAYGTNTNLPWGMTGSKIRAELAQMPGMNPEIPVHPCFLYESLWCALGFALLWLYSKRSKTRYDGQLFIMYIGWYGLGRFFIEGIRTDSLTAGSVRVSQLLSALAVIAAAVLLIFLHYRRKKQN